MNRILEDSYHKILHEKYGKIMKISGIPDRKTMVFVFDPDEIEKVRFTRKVSRLITTIKPMLGRINRINMFRYSEMKDHGQ